MKTGIERIAAKAREDANLQFTSLAHHITKDLVWESLTHIKSSSAIGIDEIDVRQAKEQFCNWIDPTISFIYRKGYKPPPVRRVWIPKPGKTEKRPIGVPCVIDRAIQRSVATVLSSIYEQDFLNCSFGGRPNRSAHNALATIDKIINSCKINWVFEADLKNFFGSLDHEWMMKFVEHRIGDPRILNIIKRWLKAGILEEGQFQTSDVGVPQGGSISVLLSNIYLHYVLDLWFEKVIRPRMKGESYLVRYIDDFIVCFQYQADAKMFQELLKSRLAKFSLELEKNKTDLIEFGRFAKERARKDNKKCKTLYFLGFTHFCSQRQDGKFMLGRKTEKSRFKRSIAKLKNVMRTNMHITIKEQANKINQVIRGFYNYYGITGNSKIIAQIYWIVIRHWRIILSKRSSKGKVTWEKFNMLLTLFPIVRPKIIIRFGDFDKYAML
jgi:RNA-directed DNA polymerase